MEHFHSEAEKLSEAVASSSQKTKFATELPHSSKTGRGIVK